MRRGELRELILGAAVGLFLEKGYEGLSMRQIAEAIGYTATTIYRYFENKDALLRAIIDEGFGRFLGALSAASRSQKEAGARLKAIGAAYIRFGMNYPLHYQLMFMQRCDLLMDGWSSATGDDSFYVLQDATREAMEAGVLRQGDPREISYLLWSMVHGLTSLRISLPTHLQKQDYEQTVEQGLEAILCGLYPNAIEQAKERKKA